MSAPRPQVWLPLAGTQCAVCGQPARYADSYRVVLHVDLRQRPCALPPFPATPAPIDIEVPS